MILLFVHIFAVGISPLCFEKGTITDTSLDCYENMLFVAIHFPISKFLISDQSQSSCAN